MRQLAKQAPDMAVLDTVAYSVPSEFAGNRSWLKDI